MHTARLRTPERRTLEVDLRFSVLRSSDDRSLLVDIEAWRDVSVAEVAEPLADAVYDISSAPFGLLKRLTGPAFVDALPGGSIGKFCYEVLHERPTPCPECPAAAFSGDARSSSVVRCRSVSSDSPCVVMGRRVDSSTMRLALWTVDRELMKKLIDAHVDVAAERFELTEREREVLRFALIGTALPDIASDLQISQSTAKFHMANVLAKLGASLARRSAALLVMKHKEA